ncbi:hypothetical protein BGZ83_009879 [Gryganskiella cystojenkinii]|nr:hypothetical protein BGZ83_009879 [Gryganskiella cystojenkinii]
MATLPPTPESTPVTGRKRRIIDDDEQEDDEEDYRDYSSRRGSVDISQMFADDSDAVNEDLSDTDVV